MKNIFLLLFLSAACTSSKVNMMPDTNIPYQTGDKLIIMRLEGVKTYLANQLYEESYRLFRPYPGIELIDESDAIYKLKQKGLSLPSYDKLSKENLNQIRLKEGIDFILVSKVLNKSDYVSQASKDVPGLQEMSPTRKATLSFKLYDLKAKTVTVVLDIKTTISPLSWQDKNGGKHDFNPSSSTGAINKAYKKAIKRLYRAFECC